MSRFELFFVVLDEQKTNVDEKISHYILSLHQCGEEFLRETVSYSEEDLRLYISYARNP
jgi:DNA replicative helicase MCM subunit Mcm2 (Cdc46/Mcm family)